MGPPERVLHREQDLKVIQPETAAIQLPIHRQAGGGSNVSPSGDTTYKVNVSGLTKKTVYIVERAVITNPPKGIMEHDIARLICSLQGLINRDMTKNQIALYIQYDDTDTFWYNQMAASGGVLNGYSKVTISSFTKFLVHLKLSFKAAV